MWLGIDDGDGMAEVGVCIELVDEEVGEVGAINFVPDGVGTEDMDVASSR